MQNTPLLIDDIKYNDLILLTLLCNFVHQGTW